jgi:hypothetical protein
MIVPSQAARHFNFKGASIALGYFVAQSSLQVGVVVPHFPLPFKIRPAKSF